MRYVTILHPQPFKNLRRFPNQHFGNHGWLKTVTSAENSSGNEIHSGEYCGTEIHPFGGIKYFESLWLVDLDPPVIRESPNY